MLLLGGTVYGHNSNNYFPKEEKKMLDYVLMGISDVYRKNLFNNIAGFRREWENEVKSKASFRNNE